MLCAACTSAPTPAPTVSNLVPTEAPVSSLATVTTINGASNGKTLSLHVGDRLRVELGSTQWQFAASPVNVLRIDGQPNPVVGPNCAPGTGCGTVTQEFVIVGAGTAHVTATRATCGGVSPCTAALRAFAVTANVS